MRERREEILPLLSEATRSIRALGRSLLPFPPSSPLAGWVGGFPVPSTWRIRFGEPFDLEGLDRNAARDDLLLSRLSDKLRARVQELVEEGRPERAARG